MTNLKLNETPIRTSRNYGINNINLENIDLPRSTTEFDGLKITGELDQINITECKRYNSIKYGNSPILQKQIEEISNKDLQIKIDGENEKEVYFDFCFSKENENLIENILIEIAENSKCTIILRFSSKEDLEYYHNGQIKVISEKNSNLDIIILNLLNTKTNNFLSIENILKEKANVKYVTAEFGGKNNIINYYTNLEGKESNNEISTIYLGHNNQIIDLNYIVEAYGEKSNIDMDLKGAIKGNCKKHFKGTIDFKKGCKKSKGNENEYCTILSENAKSIALPMLLCTEEDIEGNHSTAAGKIDLNQLFYLMTRGFSKEDAQKLIVKAQFSKILEKISQEELKNEILNEIDKRLD